MRFACRSLILSVSFFSMMCFAVASSSVNEERYAKAMQETFTEQMSILTGGRPQGVNTNLQRRAGMLMRAWSAGKMSPDNFYSFATELFVPQMDRFFRASTPVTQRCEETEDLLAVPHVLLGEERWRELRDFSIRQLRSESPMVRAGAVELLGGFLHDRESKSRLADRFRTLTENSSSDSGLARLELFHLSRVLGMWGDRAACDQLEKIVNDLSVKQTFRFEALKVLISAKRLGVVARILQDESIDLSYALDIYDYLTSVDFLDPEICRSAIRCVDRLSSDPKKADDVRDAVLRTISLRLPTCTLSADDVRQLVGESDFDIYDKAVWRLLRSKRPSYNASGIDMSYLILTPRVFATYLEAVDGLTREREKIEAFRVARDKLKADDLLSQKSYFLRHLDSDNMDLKVMALLCLEKALKIEWPAMADVYHDVDTRILRVRQNKAP